MNINKEIKPKNKSTILLFIILTYLIGPNYKILTASIADIMFLLYMVYFYLIQRNKIILKVPFVMLYFIPFLIVSITFTGKIINGFNIGIEEVSNLLNFLKLFFIASISYAILSRLNADDNLDKELKKIGYVISIALVINSLLGIMQYFHIEMGDKIINLFYVYTDKAGAKNIDQFISTGRAVGIFGSYNGLGYFLTIATFLLIIINSQKLSNKINYIWWVSISLGVITLILTNNRASIISFVCMVLLFLAYSKKIPPIAKVILIFFLISLPFIISSSTEYLSYDNYLRIIEIRDFILYGESPHNWSVRLDVWTWLPLFIISSKYILFGIPNMVFFYSIQFTSGDNNYVNWLLYHGLVGLILFLIWTFKYLKYFIRRGKILNKNNPKILNLNKGVILIIIMQIIIGISQDSFFTMRSRELLIYFIALSVAFGKTIDIKQKIINSTP